LQIPLAAGTLVGEGVVLSPAIGAILIHLDGYRRHSNAHSFDAQNESELDQSQSLRGRTDSYSCLDKRFSQNNSTGCELAGFSSANMAMERMLVLIPFRAGIC
jgi:hypothetical protein